MILRRRLAVPKTASASAPARPLRRHAGGDGLCVPLRRAERPRRRGRRARLRGARRRLAAGRRRADGVAGPVAGAGRPARDHARQRRRRVRSRLRRADAVSRDAPRLLGQPRHPHLLPRRVRGDAGPGRQREHGFVLRIHPGAGDRGRRRDHRWRERPPPPGTARGRPARGHRRGAGDRQARRLRRPDDGGGVRAAAARGERVRPDVPGGPPRRRAVPALLPARIARHPAGPPGAPAADAERSMAAAPGAHRGGVGVVRPRSLRAVPRRRPPLALRQRGGRVLHPGAHRRRRPRRLDQLPVRSVHRERVRDRVDNDAAGHPGRGDLGRGRDVRGGSRPAAREAGGRDRRGPLPAQWRRRSGINRSRRAAGGAWGGSAPTSLPQPTSAR